MTTATTAADFHSLGIDQIPLYFKSGKPTIVLLSHEEGRVLARLEAAAKTAGAEIVVVSATEGAVNLTTKKTVVAPDEDGWGEMAALNLAIEHSKKANARKTWYVYLDFHEFWKNPIVKRRIRDMVKHLRASTSRSIFLSPVAEIPSELRYDVGMVRLSLPDRVKLREVVVRMDAQLEELIAEARLDGQDVADYALPGDNDKEVTDVVEALVGLTEVEAEDLLGLSFQLRRSFDRKLIETEKVKSIAKGGLIELYPPLNSLDDVGGYDELKSWLKMTQAAFDPAARAYGLPLPKGIMLLGVQGCGKTYLARAIAALFRCPLVIWHVSQTLGGIVGESEAKLRGVLDTFDSLGMCVILMDEVEKSFANPEGAIASGGEVTKHMIAETLTWFNDKTTPCFPVMTANGVETLPPEFLRKGRLDEIWFLDLPSRDERLKIAEVVLKKYKRDPDVFVLADIADATAQFSGAEIENAVLQAMRAAFYDGRREVNTEDVVQAAGESRPLAQLEPERINKIRQMAKGRFRVANSMDRDEDAVGGGGGKKKAVRRMAVS